MNTNSSIFNFLFNESIKPEKNVCIVFAILNQFKSNSELRKECFRCLLQFRFWLNASERNSYKNIRLFTIFFFLLLYLHKMSVFIYFLLKEDILQNVEIFEEKLNEMLYIRIFLNDFGATILFSSQGLKGQILGSAKRRDGLIHSSPLLVKKWY
jgi:hypothetical protein